MTTASARFLALVDSPAAELAACLRRGETPAADILAGGEFRGANTAGWTARLHMQQFVKGFQRRTDGRLVGYNRRVVQDGAWTAPSAAFAHFEVRPVDPSARDNRYLQALLLDYGAAGGPRLDPARRIRDYLVRAEAGSDELLVGQAFIAIGPLRISPTYFVLERLP